MFTGGKGTRELMEAMGNFTSGNEKGFLTHTNWEWFVVFEFSDIGYVKDDEKDELDADAMLKSYRKGTAQANKERERIGIPTMSIVGWEKKPSYNESTHNLEWAIRAESEGEPILNYNTRLLGRRGVMEVSLVVEPGLLSETLPVYQDLLDGYNYKSGEAYAEYRQGDKVAQYGLAALVLGGAAAAGAKLGLFGAIAVFFKKAWKLVVIGLVAVAGFIKKLFGGRTAE